MNIIINNNIKSGDILMWDGKMSIWKNISEIESERIRKNRKEKLKKINEKRN